MIKVSVVIKALNEAKNIAATIESALKAVASIGGEVILADSFSTDKTIEIASVYPIKIIRLHNPVDRCCGVGAQLGYQIAAGEYIWIVDGDMELAEDFVQHAIQALEADDRIAGVSGRVVEKNLESLEFRARVQRAPVNLQPGLVDRLDGGGVYRRNAVEAVGYLTNRNLHSYEEFELAARLRSAGWLLQRIPFDAVFHYGHQTEAFALLLRRWKSGYILGIGELLRGALGTNHFSLVLREIRELHLYLAVILWWLALLLLFACQGIVGHGGWIGLAFLLGPLLIMVLKKRSFITALYSIVSWNFYAAGLLRGFLRRQLPPTDSIPSDVVLDRVSPTR